MKITPALVLAFGGSILMLAIAIRVVTYTPAPLAISPPDPCPIEPLNGLKSDDERHQVAELKFSLGLGDASAKVGLGDDNSAKKEISETFDKLGDKYQACVILSKATICLERDKSPLAVQFAAQVQSQCLSFPGAKDEAKAELHGESTPTHAAEAEPAAAITATAAVAAPTASGIFVATLSPSLPKHGALLPVPPVLATTPAPSAPSAPLSQKTYHTTATSTEWRTFKLNSGDYASNGFYDSGDSNQEAIDGASALATKSLNKYHCSEAAKQHYPNDLPPSGMDGKAFWDAMGATLVLDGKWHDGESHSS